MKALNETGTKNLRFPADAALAERDRSCPLVSTSKTLLDNLPPVVWCFLVTDFVFLSFQTCTAVVSSLLR